MKDKKEELNYIIEGLIFRILSEIEDNKFKEDVYISNALFYDNSIISIALNYKKEGGSLDIKITHNYEILNDFYDDSSIKGIYNMIINKDNFDISKKIMEVISKQNINNKIFDLYKYKGE
jgi:hypothetical protein